MLEFLEIPEEIKIKLKNNLNNMCNKFDISGSFEEYGNSENDSKYSRLFYGLNLNNIEEEVKKRINDNRLKIKKPIINKIGEKFCLVYSSSSSNLKKNMMFPIFLIDKVLGTLNIESEEILEESTTSLKRWSFRKMKKDNTDLDSMNLGIGRCEEFVNKIVLGIDKIEKEMFLEYKKQQSLLIEEKMNDSLVFFNNELKALSLSNEKSIGKISLIAEKITKKIMDDFNIKSILTYSIFSDNANFLINKKPLVKMFGLGEINEKIYDELDLIKNSFDEFSEVTYLEGTSLDSLEYLNILKRILPFGMLTKNVEHNKCALSVFPSMVDKRTHAFYIIGFNNNACFSYQRNIYKYLCKKFHEIYKNIIYIMIDVDSNNNRKNIDKIFRIYRHETAQIASGLNFKARECFDDIDKFKNLPIKKIQDIVDDIERNIVTLKQINERYKQISVELKPEPINFFIYKEILVKWGNLFRILVNELIKEIYIKKPDGVRDPYRTSITADKTMMDQIVYNLLGNAIKYSYWGTRIKMDCKREDLNFASKHCFSVENYGSNIEDDEKVYELFYRGSQATNCDGEGIGLYVAKKMVAAHYGRIQHRCYKVSDYCVPYMELFLNTEFKRKKPEDVLYNKVETEYKRLLNKGYYYKIISSDLKKFYNNKDYKKIKNDKRITDGQLILKVKRPTYHTEFKVYI